MPCRRSRACRPCRPPRRLLLALAAAIALTTSAAACSGDDDAGDDPTTIEVTEVTETTTAAATTTNAAATTADTEAATTVPATDAPTPTTTAAATTTATSEQERAQVAELLARVPAELRPTDNPLFMTIGDLDAATEAAGLERPSPAAVSDPDAVVEWLAPLGGFQEGATVAALLPEAVVPDRLRHNDEIAAELGWSVLDVHSFIELLDPPETLSVLVTDLSANDLDRAVGPTEDGIWRLGGEDGAIEMSDISPARPLGEALRFGLRDGLLAVSRYTPPVEAFLAAEGETLADDPALHSVAAALDGAGVYSAMIADGPEQVVFAEDAGPVLDPFDLLGVGLSVRDGEAVATFVYHHESADAAQAAVDAVRRVFADAVLGTGEPLAERYTLEDVRADGELAVATATLVGDTPPLTVWRAVVSRDHPSVHG